MAKTALLEQYSNIWFDKQDYLEAERVYYEGKLGQLSCGNSNMARKNKSKQSVVPAPPTPTLPSNTILTPPLSTPIEKKRTDSECSNKAKPGEVKGKGKNKGHGPEAAHEESGNNKAAQTNSSDAKMDGIAKLSCDSPALLKKIAALETENKSFKKDIEDLTNLVNKLELRLSSLESGKPAIKQNTAAPAPSKPAPAKPAAADDDVDLFGSDSEEESEEAAKIREQRLAAYNAKKSKKPVLIAKSNIILDVKPWGDDTDMEEMEKQVRAIKMDGLLWGASKLAPLAYGIKKLQISSVVEDDLVSVDALTEAIQDIEEYVQSVDIAAFNKV